MVELSSLTASQLPVAHTVSYFANFNNSRRTLGGGSHTLRWCVIVGALSTVFAATPSFGQKCRYFVEGDFGLVDVKTTVNCPVASYYFSNYRNGLHNNRNYDETISNIQARLNLSLETTPHDLCLSKCSTDLVSAIYCDTLLRLNRVDCELVAEQIKDPNLATRLKNQESADRPLLIVVPGAFYQRVESLAKSLDSFRRVAKECGYKVHFVHTEELGSVDENAYMVQRAIAEAHATGQRFLILSMSRGALEVAIALDHLRARPEIHNLTCWISVCGAPQGSPLADQAITPKRCIITKLMLIKTGGGTLESLKEMSVESGRCRFRRIQLPDVPKITVLPILLSGKADHIQRRYNYLSTMGPNDGTVLASQSIIPGSTVFPMLGCDHDGTHVDVNAVGLAFIQYAQKHMR